MTDKEKLKLIDRMIADGWEFSPSPANGVDRLCGFYDGVLVCIGAVIGVEDENESKGTD